MAFIAWEIVGRIGPTSPMPMKVTIDANATAHTAGGWRNSDDFTAPASVNTLPFAGRAMGVLQSKGWAVSIVY
ncbi:hypothetical protein GCM10023063_33160 [Arthrobacter methylotrophus]